MLGVLYYSYGVPFAVLPRTCFRERKKKREKISCALLLELWCWFPRVYLISTVEQFIHMLSKINRTLPENLLGPE